MARSKKLIKPRPRTMEEVELQDKLLQHSIELEEEELEAEERVYRSRPETMEEWQKWLASMTEQTQFLGTSKQ